MSLVIPVKGHPVLLDDALASVLREMAAGTITRVVVVNDGCDHPETRRALAAWQVLLGPVMVVVSQPNGGLSAARNRGIEMALALDPDAKAVFLLDADNLLAEGAGRLMGQLLRDGRDHDWFYPAFDFFGQTGHFVTEPEFNLLLQAEANQCDAGSLIRRHLLEAGVRFDERMRDGYEDWDFWLQAARLGFRGRAADQPLLHYRKRPASMLSRSHEQDAELRHFLRRKHGWLFNAAGLTDLEAAHFPRFALVSGEERRVVLCVDPDHRSPVRLPDFERMVMAAMADPHGHHAPAHVVFLRAGVARYLRDARLMHTVLWNLERRALRQPRDLDLLFLGQHETGGIAICPDGALPDRQPDAICLRMSRLQDWVRAGDDDLLHRLDTARGALETGGWTLHCPGPTPALAGQAGADEVLRATLLSLARSPYRQALDMGWTWRAPGGAISRDRVPAIPRSTASGGPLFPLQRAHGTVDVAVVVPIFSFGGVEKVAASIACELAAANYRLHLFVVSDRPIEADTWSLAPFHTINWLPDAGALDWNGPEFMGTAAPDWGSHDELADLTGLLSGMHVVINAHSAALHKVADRLRQQGVVMIDHEHLVERSTYGRAYGPPVLALAYEHAYDLFLTCSDGMLTWMHAHGVPRDKLMAIRNAPGYPMDAAEQRGLMRARAAAADPQAPLRVLFLGRLDKQKGIERVAAIFAMLAGKAPDLELSLGGRAVLEDAAQPRAWPPRTRFLGALRGPEALTRRLAATDVMILPSHYEGLPLSILEAQRCGVTVIATDAGAVDEAIEDGRTGFVVPQQDCVERIVSLVLALDRDRARLARIGQAAAAESHDWASAAQGLRQWLDRRLARGAQPVDALRQRVGLLAGTR